MQNALDGLQSLIDEFGKLDALDGYTAQTRGQRFNHHVADMLRWWSVSADVAVSAEGVGEIDVTFTLDGVRYLVEAKWEAGKTDATAIMKLQGRLSQRMTGTVGLFIAMAGYTPDALSDIDKGRRLDMLLFDRDHFEAMLSGFAPPQELIELAHDRASFKGQPYVPLLDLLTTRQSAPRITFTVPADFEAELLRSATENLSATALCSTVDSTQLGIAASGPRRILLTLQDGIAEVDLARKQAAWKVPIHGCHGNPVSHIDGAVVFVRNHGVGQLSAGTLTIVGGGFAASPSIVGKNDGTTWVLGTDHRNWQPSNVVTMLGSKLGFQRQHSIPGHMGAATDGAWIGDGPLMVATNNAVAVTNLDGQAPSLRHAAMSNLAAIAPASDDAVLCLGDFGRLQLIDLSTGRHAQVTTLPWRPSILAMDSNQEGTYYIAGFFGSPELRTAVVELSIRLPLKDFADFAFQRADTGDRSGYAAQVNRLAALSVPMPDPADIPHFEALYNEAHTLVGQHLITPITELVQAVGLKNASFSIRAVDGWPPPEYGGSASQPRWTIDDKPGMPWLEASLGVSHRAWPAPNVADTIITLMFARMDAESQHSYLTRFVPFRPGDPTLSQTIRDLCDEAKSLLPDMIKDLATAST